MPITGRTVLEPGAVVRLGSTEIIMIGRADRVEPAVVRRTLRAGDAAALVIPRPPAAPEVPRPPSPMSRFWAQVLGTAPRPGEPLFPAYTEMRRRLPPKAWHGIRIASVLAYLALCITLFIRPAGGQFWFFKVIVPLLPILFLTAPGLWRNICPLAASNQAPRWFGFTRAFTPPDWLRRYGALISIVLFFGITSTRIAFFNSNGAGLSVLLLVTIIGAFITGTAFKGKSGWCSSTCPLLPLQRVYGQTPFANVPNSHCQPCVGCTKNCYDFRPSVAYQADLHDPDPNWTAPRKLFVSALPIVSVVVLGNGIAGVTAADFVRRGHPDCEIHVVGSESHVLYNRMGISRLVYGRSAMQGLYLLPEQWYDDHQVVAWLNTQASRIDLASRRVFLATGDTLPYDRLILATGSSSASPPVAGFGRPGSFVLRSAADAIQIRAYAQEHGGREAVVAGGGLLGLEAAHSLHELGLRVTVLERGSRLLSRQIDEYCSELVDAHFARIGMQVLYRAESESLASQDRVRGVTLTDGRTLGCDVFLAAVGIRPNVELARQAGITVNRGIVVNDRMETSAPGVFAAGDVAEHGRQVFGLWPIAAKQGEAAAVNALGGHLELTSEVPATILKGVGLDLYLDRPARGPAGRSGRGRRGPRSVGSVLPAAAALGRTGSGRHRAGQPSRGRRRGHGGGQEPRGDFSGPGRRAAARQLGAAEGRGPGLTAGWRLAPGPAGCGP